MNDSVRVSCFYIVTNCTRTNPPRAQETQPTTAKKPRTSQTKPMPLSEETNQQPEQDAVVDNSMSTSDENISTQSTDTVPPSTSTSKTDANDVSSPCQLPPAGTNAPHVSVEDTNQFCIDDDDAENLDPGDDSAIISAEEGTKKPTATAATSRNAAKAATASPASEIITPPHSQETPRLPPRITNVKASATKSPKAAAAPPPQSQKVADSVFGPFVDPVVNAEWNPFGGGDLPGEMFDVDADESIDITNNTNEAGSNVHQSQLERSSSSAAAEAELDGLRRIFDSEYERALEDQEISWRARYAATRWSFILSAICMIVYLWLGCMFYRSEAGWSVPDALLFTVYTVTTVGYGGPQPLPNTAAFHAFTSMYVLVGISGVTVLGAHTYQLISLEATRIRASPLKKKRRNNNQTQDESDEFEQEEGDDSGMARFRRQFMSELEERVRDQPFLDQLLDNCITRIKEFRTYLRTTKAGRVLGVTLPFVGMINLGALVVGLIEGWTPLESIYWSIVTLTTVGYGDYVPKEDSSVWFCTLFFIPSSLFFLSFFLAHVAKSYIQLHAIHVTRLERRMRRKLERKRAKKERAEQAKRNASTDNTPDAQQPEEDNSSPPTSPGSTGVTEVESGFTTISYCEDEDESNSRGSHNIGLFGDNAGMETDSTHNNASNTLSTGASPGMRYRDSVVRNKLRAPDPDGKRPVSFAEALRSLNQPLSSQTSGESSHPEQDAASNNRGSPKPSLDVRLRVQERLARIIAEEVAGYQTGVQIKGSTVSLTIETLRETADKWKIPLGAWKAFRAVAFRSLLFVGERELISDGGDALLRLNAIEFHGIFSPMLAAMGDGTSMEEWLAETDILADVELRKDSSEGGKRETSSRDKPVFSGTFT